MAILVKDIVRQAHILCGDISDEEPVQGTAATQSVMQLNNLIHQLNTQQLFPFSRKVMDFTVPAPKLSYTIGETYTENNITYTADIVTPRPAYINRLLYLTNSGSSPRDVIQLELSDVLNRTSSPTAQGLPSCFGVNPEYPHSTIYFDSASQSGSHLLIVYNVAIPTVTIASSLNIPLEYMQALTTGLARLVAIRQQMPAETLNNMNVLWSESYDNLVQSNSRIVTPLMSTGIGTLGGYNPYVYSATGWVGG